jgi:hypothetical protein
MKITEDVRKYAAELSITVGGKTFGDVGAVYYEVSRWVPSSKTRISTVADDSMTSDAHAAAPQVLNDE